MMGWFLLLWKMFGGEDTATFSCGEITLTGKHDGAVSMASKHDGTISITGKHDGTVEFDQC
jgi:hypothetical protein